ncbi:MAG: tRNA lysidine(34) synthetase TilS, partial [Candidatus Thiodiazotropha sp.]
KIFQEYGIPPWERDRIPLIYIDGELAAIPGLFICEGFTSAASELGTQLHMSGEKVELPKSDFPK